VTIAGFDLTSANIFKKKLAFDVHWEEISGARVNPRMEVVEFYIGGLQFQFAVHFPNDAGLFPYVLWMGLTEASKKTLAAGYKIEVNYTYNWSIKNGGKGTPITCFTTMESDGAILFRFTPIDRLEFDLEMEFQDVFPHRLQFVDEEVAKKNGSDCTIVLVDDADKQIFVHKHFLAFRSEFFRRLFFGDFKERNQDSVPISDVKEEDLLEYLYCVYPAPNRPLEFKRVESLLILADRFQNDLLVFTIEKFLTEKMDMTAMEKQQTLVLAGTYNMFALFRDTLMAWRRRN